MSTGEVRSASGHPSWRILKSERLLDALPWVEVWRETVEIPDGAVVDDYHVVRIPDFAIAVAFTANGELIVERQYRHGIREVVLDLPAGRIEPGEAPLEAARRELREETGYSSGLWRRLGAFALSDSRIPARAHLFLAEDVDWKGPPSSGDLEHTEVLLFSPEQFQAAIGAGEVGDVCAVAAFMLAQATRER